MKSISKEKKKSTKLEIATRRAIKAFYKFGLITHEEYLENKAIWR